MADAGGGGRTLGPHWLHTAAAVAALPSAQLLLLLAAAPAAVGACEEREKEGKEEGEYVVQKLYNPQIV